MADILLAKPTLPDFIDASVGEAHVVRDALFQVFDMKKWELPTPEHCWEYPPPAGYKHLVDLLEHKHGAPVVITNGAKQALGATFYALKKMDRSIVEMRVPYWTLIPPLLEMHGCTCVPTMKNPPHHSDSEFWKHDAFLMLGPNNPDGWMHDDHELLEMHKMFKEANKPFIHDAAYYTHSYLPRDRQLMPLGDVQIYSLSKMLGLSGLRVGYAVCPNKDFYKLIKEYMEAMTVGVSLPSQMFAFDLLNQMRGYPTRVEKFENISYAALEESKRIIRQVDPEILEIPADIPGMFGFFKKGSNADFNKAKVNVLDGSLFGNDSCIRMNLAFKPDIMEDIVRRLNGTLSV